MVVECLATSLVMILPWRNGYSWMAARMTRILGSFIPTPALSIKEACICSGAYLTPLNRQIGSSATKSIQHNGNN